MLLNLLDILINIYYIYNYRIYFYEKEEIINKIIKTIEA